MSLTNTNASRRSTSNCRTSTLSNPAGRRRTLYAGRSDSTNSFHRTPMTTAVCLRRMRPLHALVYTTVSSLAPRPAVYTSAPPAAAARGTAVCSSVHPARLRLTTAPVTSCDWQTGHARLGHGVITFSAGAVQCATAHSAVHGPRRLVRQPFLRLPGAPHTRRTVSKTSRGVRGHYARSRRLPSRIISGQCEPLCRDP